eukprot:CAMPEP_0175806696 /NCGR_PEP_ID=MMETSP0107_2-20121207/1327_1 /TAXON_ID=195067 ORGANISM="Goniomonas pacifica, Strain CCMP1869" /NCGR_SAMPLE_ID=MMETSP0107_2 /ASSEMBLY_ACC=CAM_ASM_000203 /LENGTH=88 /DNA_ID=CAMNT_0017118201 /DNA_START=59 /DNA_END=322 /DNA_ORIENTATION=-
MRAKLAFEDQAEQVQRSLGLEGHDLDVTMGLLAAAEYISAELVELSGNLVPKGRRQITLPLVRKAIHDDEELQLLVERLASGPLTKSA